MDLRQAKKIIETMKDIDSRGNLTESSKVLLPYLNWLIEQAEKVPQLEQELSFWKEIAESCECTNK